MNYVSYPNRNNAKEDRKLHIIKICERLERKIDVMRHEAKAMNRTTRQQDCEDLRVYVQKLKEYALV